MMSSCENFYYPPDIPRPWVFAQISHASPGATFFGSPHPRQSGNLTLNNAKEKPTKQWPGLVNRVGFVVQGNFIGSVLTEAISAFKTAAYRRGVDTLREWREEEIVKAPGPKYLYQKKHIKTSRRVSGRLVAYSTIPRR